MARLQLTRDQILGHRRRAGALDTRLLAGRASLVKAAYAGLQDSMPRAALLSLHARVDGVGPGSWEDPALMQVWGPRWAVYVIAARDRALFTVARSDDARRRRVAEEMAALFAANVPVGQRMRYDDAVVGIKTTPVLARYVAETGTVGIRWDGARQPDVWITPRPEMSPEAARREVARRHLHVFGPTSAAGFASWLGVKPPAARATYADLAAADELLAVTTPIGDGLILASGEASFRSQPGEPAAARLLPSGDAFTLLKGDERELLVPSAANRDALWTPRVWPGALLVGGEIVGTWRRDQHNVTANAWRKLTAAEIAAVEAEAASLPLPGLTKLIAVTWGTHA